MPFHSLNFSDWDASTVTIPTLATNARKCAYHPQNLAIKNVILKNFKILRNASETKNIFSLPPLISFKRDKNLDNFLVRSAFKRDNQTRNLHTQPMQNLSLYFKHSYDLRTQSIR